MILYPAIDLKDGRCVRLLKGDFDRETVFNDDPADQAAQFQAQGFRWLHVVDLNGAVEGRAVNRSSVEAILAAVTIPVQLGGGIRDMAGIEMWLARGLSRVILGTAALTDPGLVRQAAQAFPGKVAVGIDARDGRVATQGWLETSDVTAIDLARSFEDAGVAAIVYTDIDRDGALQGVNVEATAGLARALATPVIASGGVAGLEDLRGAEAGRRPAGSKASFAAGRSMTEKSIHNRRLHCSILKYERTYKYGRETGWLTAQRARSGPEAANPSSAGRSTTGRTRPSPRSSRPSFSRPISPAPSRRTRRAGASQWAFTQGAAAFVMAILSPILGAIADHGRGRKAWIVFWTLIMVAASAALWWGAPGVDSTVLVLTAAFIGVIGFEMGLVFYNAMLPGLAPRSHIGRLSGWSWGSGLYRRPGLPGPAAVPVRPAGGCAFRPRQGSGRAYPDRRPGGRPVGAGLQPAIVLFHRRHAGGRAAHGPGGRRRAAQTGQHPRQYPETPEYCALSWLPGFSMSMG